MSKPMIHTLKTLYFWANRQYPKLTAELPGLEDYCLNDNKQHPPYTLGWLIYSLRFKISQGELQRVFYFALVEAHFYGEQFLYSDIRKFYIIYDYRNLLP